MNSFCYIIAIFSPPSPVEIDHTEVFAIFFKTSLNSKDLNIL